MHACCHDDHGGVSRGLTFGPTAERMPWFLNMARSTSGAAYSGVPPATLQLDRHDEVLHSLSMLDALPLLGTVHRLPQVTALSTLTAQESSLMCVTSASPKSASFMLPWCTSTFSGLRSRCE